jgi:hypothetical protein
MAVVKPAAAWTLPGREHTSAFYGMQLWFDRFSRNFSIISVRQRRNRLDKESSIYVTLTDQPLSPEEVSDIAELRLALISLAVKPAHRHLAPADFDHAYHLSKLTGQTTVVKEQITTAGRAGAPASVSRSTHEISRPLLTADEAMRMKGPLKDPTGMILEPGEMVVYVAGYPAIRGVQPLYFKDSELFRRARMSAPDIAK